MKINEKILHIPPYISTAWENIETLHTEDGFLIITLKSGSKIEIPSLPSQIITSIFSSHSKFVENQNKSKNSISFGLPFGINETNIPGGIDSITTAMKHNENQKNMPDLPKDILNKIASITKIFSEETPIEMPKPEENCNCTYCQIARTMQLSSGINPENLDEEVSDKELKFRLWDIEEAGKNLYIVTNPLDHNEKYQVFLGQPIGCTCGFKNCEHIKAVLQT